MLRALHRDGTLGETMADRIVRETLEAQAVGGAGVGAGVRAGQGLEQQRKGCDSSSVTVRLGLVLACTHHERRQQAWHRAGSQWVQPTTAAVDPVAAAAG
jgi:hypothetical protein